MNPISESVSGVWPLSNVDRRRWILPLLGLLLSLSFLLGAGWGALPVSADKVVRILLSRVGLASVQGISEAEITVILNIRLPRVLLGVFVGACLGAGGGALQGLLRNPLAEPSLIGVSGGAALAAVASLFFFTQSTAFIQHPIALFGTPMFAFAGGVGMTLLALKLATREGRADITTLLLAGIAMNAISASGMGLLIYFSNDQQMRAILFWTLGSLGSALWQTLLPALPFLLISIVGLLWFSQPLNLYLLGESEARHLGVETDRLKKWIVLLVALGVGVSVALCGIIGFFGLVIPHILRLWIGPDHRLLLPGSALLGASMMLMADLASRLLIAPAELPIGLITSAVGSPFFLFLLIRNRDRYGG